jgi:hypothetical protein
VSSSRWLLPLAAARCVPWNARNLNTPASANLKGAIRWNIHCTCVAILILTIAAPRRGYACSPPRLSHNTRVICVNDLRETLKGYARPLPLSSAVAPLRALSLLCG